MFTFTTFAKQSVARAKFVETLAKKRDLKGQKGIVSVAKLEYTANCFIFNIN